MASETTFDYFPQRFLKGPLANPSPAAEPPSGYPSLPVPRGNRYRQWHGDRIFPQEIDKTPFVSACALDRSTQ